MRARRLRKQHNAFVADKRLLLVAAPDAEDLRRALEATLTRDPIAVRTATDGTAALGLAVELRPDVILLDLGMPDLAKDEVFETLQDDPVLSEIPLVCIAVSAADEAVRDLRRHEYVVRPIDADALSAQVSAAIVIKSLRDTLREDLARIDLASRTDYVTGLWNRTHVTEQIPAIAAGARRQHLPFGVVIVDVDHLGAINRQHGESGGNDVLRHIGTRLRDTARIEDLCGRWGGEQLIAVLPATDLDGAWRLGERLRVAALERPVPLREGGDCAVSISVGCAASDHAEPDTVVRAAETALRLARESGRNQVRAEPV